jgi:O-antigen biosynthesis protein WbqP
MNSKRAFDLVVGLPLTIAALPIMAATAAVVLLTSGWPVLLRQDRIGAFERRIRVLKFRTMRVGVPVVAKAALRKESNIYTPVGVFLRRWSLDELPQLLNVLTGEMSLVGPRPALPSQDDLLALRRRSHVSDLKPGLTGLAQIEGREALTLSTKARFEAIYRQNHTVCYDVVILFRTVQALASGRGAT